MRFARRIVSALIMTIAAAGAIRVKVGEELRRATAGGDRFAFLHMTVALNDSLARRRWRRRPPTSQLCGDDQLSPFDPRRDPFPELAAGDIVVLALPGAIGDSSNRLAAQGVSHHPR